MDRHNTDHTATRDADFGARIIDMLQESLLVLEPDLRVKSANRAFYDTFKVMRDEVEGRHIAEVGHGEWNIPELRRALSAETPIENAMHQIVLEHQSAKLDKRTLSITIRSLEFGRLILLVIEDITERRESERRQDILMGELQHRVKNILASVQAIARMTYQRSTSLAEFWTSFQGRLMALATTQELLTRAKLEKVSLEELVERELVAQGARAQNYSMHGPTVNLTAKAAQNLALALHELTTNATKHGALSQEGEGCVKVSWRMENGGVRFEWIESGGPTVIKPARRGFGTELMEKAIPYQLRGKTKLDFAPEGLRCTMEFGIQGNVVPGDGPDSPGPSESPRR